MRRRHAHFGHADNGLCASGTFAAVVSGPAQDNQLSRELRHKWRCSCGHTEVACDQFDLRAQALAHHAERHTIAKVVAA